MMNNKDRNITEGIKGLASCSLASIGFIVVMVVIAISIDIYF